MQTLSDVLFRFLASRHLRVEKLEVEFVPFPPKNALFVRFLPAESYFLYGDRAWREIVRWMVVFLVAKGFSRGMDVLQVSVNTWCRCRSVYEVLVKYTCDSGRLRELERHHHSLFRPLSGLGFSDVVSIGLVYKGFTFAKSLPPEECPRSMCVDETVLVCWLLCCGECDWLSLQEVAGIVGKTVCPRAAEARSGRTAKTLRVVGRLLKRGLVCVGDCRVLPGNEDVVVQWVFAEWPCPRDAAMGRIREALKDSVDEPPPHRTCWFRNTDRAQTFLDAHPREVVAVKQWTLAACDRERGKNA